jgi:hypothetical protein
MSKAHTALHTTVAVLSTATLLGLGYAWNKADSLHRSIQQELSVSRTMKYAEIKATIDAARTTVGDCKNWPGVDCRAELLKYELQLEQYEKAARIRGFSDLEARAKTVRTQIETYSFE